MAMARGGNSPDGLPYDLRNPIWVQGHGDGNTKIGMTAAVAAGGVAACATP